MVDNLETRWPHFNTEIPMRSGKLKTLSKFDAHFFGLPLKQANTLEPQIRILLEQSYEAILDAGINPKSLQGANYGVFIAVSQSESEKSWLYEGKEVDGSGLTG